MSREITQSTIERALAGDKEAARQCTEAEVLLPCPFCGGEAEAVWLCGHGHIAWCKDRANCKARGVYRIDETSAIEAWNRRVQPNGWIKMEDRKPVGDCIAYEANRLGVCLCIHSEWEASDWNVIHWMALPEPPKEVDAE